MLEVRLLGTVRAQFHGEPIALSRRLERALLARLALGPGQPVPVDRLIDDLWGLQPPRDGQGSVQGLVYRLRRTLGEAGSAVASTAGGYALDVPAQWVDAARFELLVAEARAAPADTPLRARLLREALALWHGEALSGVEAPFVPNQRSRLDALRLSALADRFEAELREGHAGELVPELEAVIAEHPYQERFWAQLMLAYYRSGSQAAAVGCFARLAALLAEEKGLEPSPALADLEHRILNHDASLAWGTPAAVGGLASGLSGRGGAPAGAPVPAGPLPDTGSSGRHPPGPEVPGEVERSDLSWRPRDTAEILVGRQEELRAALAARDLSADGRVLLVVTGEPGVGKTRLVAGLAEMADLRGDLVIHGSWDEQLLCPFQAFREALGGYARRAPAEALRADVGELGGVIGRVVPEIEDRLGHHDDAGRAAPEGDRYRIFHALDAWLGAIARRRRLVLVLDDLQWADPPSLLLLEHLLRAPERAPFLIVATCRHHEADKDSWLAESLAGLRRSAATVHLLLGGLSAPETVDLLAACLARDLKAAERAGAVNLHRHTAGNPFFVQAVARDLLEGSGSLAAWSSAGPLPLPEQLRDVVRWRLRQLPSSAVDVLAAASVVGDVFASRPVADALGCDDERFLAALDEARRTGVITDDPEGSDTYRFTHAVVRQTLYEDLGQSRRVRLHHRTAQALEAWYGDRAHAHAAELAHHFYLGMAAGGGELALDYAVAAAHEALSQFAYQPAAEQFERAIEIARFHHPGDLSLLCQLRLDHAAALLKDGNLAPANGGYLEAYEAAKACGRPDLMARAALGYGGVLPAGADPDEQARALVSGALREMGDARDAGDDALRSLLMGRLAQWGHQDRPRREREMLANPAVALAAGTGDPRTEAAVRISRYWALCGADDGPGQLAEATAIRRIGKLLEDPEVELQGLKCELHSRFELGDHSGSLRVGAEIARLADDLRQPEYLRLALMWDSLLAGMEGRDQEAEQLAAQAVAVFERTGHPQAAAVYVGLCLPWRWLQGRMAELSFLVADRDATSVALAERSLMAWIAAETADTARSREILATMGEDDIRGAEHGFHWWFLAVSLAQAAIILEDRRLADVVYGEIAPFADHNCRAGQATFLGAAALHLGMLASLLGDQERAVGHLEAALDRHRAMGARRFEILTLRQLASARRRRGGCGDRQAADALEALAEEIPAELGLRRVLSATP